MLNLFLDPAIADWTPFSKVRKQAVSMLDAERFAQVSEYMCKIEFDKTAFEWSFYGTLHSRFKLNLRHLFASLDFAGLVEDAPLLEAVAFLQEILRHGRSPRQMNPSNFPAGIIAKGVQRYMYTEAEKRKDRRLDVAHRKWWRCRPQITRACIRAAAYRSGRVRADLLRPHGSSYKMLPSAG
nr:hypothetical protein [Edaphobacter aggregans]